MKEYSTFGHMREVKNLDSNLGYYMLHHGVISNDSLITKLRVVFDGSAKTSTDYSVNDLQMVEPTIQKHLFFILIRFREHLYTFCADLEKMYRQITVSPDQTKF